MNIKYDEISLENIFVVVYRILRDSNTHVYCKGLHPSLLIIGHDMSITVFIVFRKGLTHDSSTCLFYVFDTANASRRDVLLNDIKVKYNKLKTFYVRMHCGMSRLCMKQRDLMDRRDRINYLLRIYKSSMSLFYRDKLSKIKNFI